MLISILNKYLDIPIYLDNRTPLHGSVEFHIQRQLALFLCPSKAQQFVSKGRNVYRFRIQ